MEPIKTINLSSCYDFSRLVIFRWASLFESGLILCNQARIVLGLLLYLMFCHKLTIKEGDCKVHVFWQCQTMSNYVLLLSFYVFQSYN